MRAVQYALSKGFTAKNDTCEWKLGDYRWFFNGKKETVDGVPFAHLAVFNAGDFPVALCSPAGGNVIGDLEVEDKLIGLLKAENPVAL
jgi:hypothetical protein